MRHIVLTTLLLGLPFAAGAQDEQQTGQTQQGAQPQTQEDAQQQDQQTQSEQSQQDAQQTQQQSGQGATTQDDRAFGRQSRTVSAEPEDMSAAGGEAEAERAQFASNVENREPVDEATSDISVSQDPLYFFTEIKNGSGQTITHRWLHNGEVMAEVPLQIGSDSWRTWSSKEMMPGWDGEWTVEVVDASGNVIAEESINVDTSGVQPQNVGYSPDDQGASPQQTSGEGETQDDQQQSSGMEDEEDWQGDALPEEIDYETTDEATDSSMEDDNVDEDGSGDNLKQDNRY